MLAASADVTRTFFLTDAQMVSRWRPRVGRIDLMGVLQMGEIR